jgi:farnesyl diphosphate synthase
MQAYFLVADDIMDKSITRRGQPCWYRAEGVGLIAINDGILLECLIYFVLRKHLRGHAAYPHLLDLFLETTHQTAHGQLLDLITAPVGVPDLTRFSLERYDTSFCSVQVL